MIELPFGRRLGAGGPCFIAAEVGINHNGDLALAHSLIDEAAAAGADGVKFQNYATDDFIADRSLTYSYETATGERVVESQYDLFKRAELDPQQLVELRRHCDDRHVVFFSTPTSQAGVNDLVSIGAPLLKNGSDFLCNTDVVAAMASSGIPTVLSTGMATLDEIAEAVAVFRGNGGSQLVLLHCTSSYPAPMADVDLRAIPALAARFDCPIGFSDHTAGTTAAVGAVALGAVMVEKHFTLDHHLAGPDHRFSLDPAELAAFVRAVRDVELALGDGSVGPTPSEVAGRREFRLSCVAARDLEAGQRLDRDDIVFRRPGTGLPPSARDGLVGRTLARAVRAGEVLTAGDLQ